MKAQLNLFQKIIREIKRPFKKKSKRKKKGYIFEADGLATNNNCQFLNDERFIRANKAGIKSTPEWENSDFRWRQRVVCWAAEYASRLPGDFVECGVNKGFFSRMILEYIDFEKTGKTFWLLDTFKGLIKEQLSEQEKERMPMLLSAYSECYDAVCETFRPFEKFVKIIRGTVPDTLPNVTSDQIAYLSIDMNCTLPEIAAAEYFWPKLVCGGVVVLDDYGFDSHDEQRKAFNRFVEEKNASLLPLPTGQGIIIKTK